MDGLPCVTVASARTGRRPLLLQKTEPPTREEFMHETKMLYFMTVPFGHRWTKVLDGETNWRFFERKYSDESISI